MEVPTRSADPRPAEQTKCAGIPPLTPAQRIIPGGRSLAGGINARLDRLADRVVLFRWGSLIFVTFGCLAGLGTLLSLGCMGVILTGQGVSPTAFLWLALSGSAAIVVGSWLLAQLLDWHLILASPRRMLRRPVFVSWGGLAGVLALLTLPAPLWHVSALLLLDAAARAVPLGHALGRLGCLSYGCCYGRPTRGPLAIRYRNPESKAVRVAGLRNVPLHPVALYEAVLDFGILGVTNGASLLGVPLGVPFALGLVLYGGGRFAIESLRDERNGALVPLGLRGAKRRSLPLSRLLCTSMALLGTALLARWLERPVWAPAVHWQTALAGFPALLPAIVLPAFLVFVAFAVHRHRVGEW